MTDFIYDNETYPNVFTVTIYNPEKDKIGQFEMSHRKNDAERLYRVLRAMHKNGDRLVGFNNFYFDYPVLDTFLESYDPSLAGLQYAEVCYAKAQKIIDSRDDERFEHVVWANNQYVKQVDLYLIHHFDNKARSTSLKLLEFNMRMESIQDLPFPPGTVLNDDQIDVLLNYNTHDVMATHKFFLESEDALRLRAELSEKYRIDFTNANDTKIGKQYFIQRLEQTLGEGTCFVKDSSGRRQPRQTKRKQIAIDDVIFPYVKFERPEFKAVLSWLRRQVIKETKGVFTKLPRGSMGELENYCDMTGPKGTVKNLNVIVDGFRFDFSTGGIHGSVESQIVDSDDEFVILDLDVTSYYPSIAIVNRVYPAHLGEAFCDIYADVKHERVQYKKGSPENAMLKLALNGVYGDSNNKYSPFYDPQYTMFITVNGQLLLCMLAERLMTVDGLSMVQINTDGLTVRVRRDQLGRVRKIASDWEFETGLDLEDAIYSRMFIRDVNNYLALYENGEVKRKGAYEYDVEWHQDHSSLVIPKAVEAHLIHGKDVQEFIENHEDTYDFFLRTKVPRTSRLLYVDDLMGEQVIQNITRYYISREGGKLVKVMPPLKGKTEERRIGINKGQLVTVCNDSTSICRDNLDVSWYVGEAYKMIDPLKRHS